MPRMHRRTLLQLGLGTGLLFTLAAAGLGLARPGLVDQKLTASGQAVFRAVARAVLAGVLPSEPAAQPAALLAHLQRVDNTIAGLPPAVQAELAQLLAVLAHPAGRLALAGLTPDWPDATSAQVHSALQSMRQSSMDLRQQVYHALRDLTNASFFANPGSWSLMGYPGPRGV
jgi:hypothetical protein